jgi:hypothetical protein
MPGFVEDEHVEQRVVRLPERVRRPGAVAVDQLVAVAEGHGSLQGEHHHRRIQTGENRVHRKL